MVDARLQLTEDPHARPDRAAQLHDVLLERQHLGAILGPQRRQVERFDLERHGLRQRRHDTRNLLLERRRERAAQHQRPPTPVPAETDRVGARIAQVPRDAVHTLAPGSIHSPHDRA